MIFEGNLKYRQRGIHVYMYVYALCVSVYGLVTKVHVFALGNDIMVPHEYRVVFHSVYA